MTQLFTRAALMGALTFGMLGCDTGTDPGRGGEAEVLLARGSVTAQSLASALVSEEASLFSALATGPVALDNVASITLDITRVDALPAQADTASETAWISLEVTAGGQINLLALPAADEGGLTLARGELPAGTYSNVRLFVENPTITLRDAVRVGQQTYPADQPIPLFIPSGAQTGLKTSISFTVADGEAPDVKLIFDAGASVNRIIATGAGRLILPPVLGARTEND